MAVYLVQRPTVSKGGRVPDLSSASDYGPIVVLLEQDEQAGLLPGRTTHKMRKRLAAFTTEDYLLWAGGDPCALVIASALAAERTGGKFKFLRWERKRDPDGRRVGGFYIPVNLDFT